MVCFQETSILTVYWEKALASYHVGPFPHGLEGLQNIPAWQLPTPGTHEESKREKNKEEDAMFFMT